MKGSGTLAAISLAIKNLFDHGTSLIPGLMATSGEQVLHTGDANLLAAVVLSIVGQTTVEKLIGDRSRSEQLSDIRELIEQQTKLETGNLVLALQQIRHELDQGQGDDRIERCRLDQLIALVDDLAEGNFGILSVLDRHSDTLKRVEICLEHIGAETLSTIREESREIEHRLEEVQTGQLENRDLLEEILDRLTGASVTMPWAEVQRSPLSSEHIGPVKLPRHAARELIGRSRPLGWLTRALNGSTHIATVVAFGGVGKTALLAEWSARFAKSEWSGIERYFEWSFYSQGTNERSQASSDLFINNALVFFGDVNPASGSPHDKGERLACLIAKHRAVLVLDGLEPLQHGPGPLAGRLDKDPAIRSFLMSLAQQPFNGLCVITTRETVTDLDRWLGKTVAEMKLEYLSEKAGASLLHEAGVTSVGGKSDIAPDDPELLSISRRFRGHALTLRLIGNYLALAWEGNALQLDSISLPEADPHFVTNSTLDSPYGHAFKVMAVYEDWLKREGSEGERELAVLRMLALFDRPAPRDCLRSLRAAPTIPGINDLFSSQSESVWNIALKRLEEVDLLAVHENGDVECHPLLREYFGERLKDRHDADQAPSTAAHLRLYEHFQRAAPQYPKSLCDMMPLFHAIRHGCEAGLSDHAFHKVYLKRICRDNRHYSSFALGAQHMNLAALTNFFDVPWSETVSGLDTRTKARLLNVTSCQLQAVGRMEESLCPTHAGLELELELEDWVNASATACNLLHVYFYLGNLCSAIKYGELSLELLTRTKDNPAVNIARLSYLTSLATALYGAGAGTSAHSAFREAVRQFKAITNNSVLPLLSGYLHSQRQMDDIELTLSAHPSQDEVGTCLDRLKSIRSATISMLGFMERSSELRGQSLRSSGHGHLTIGRTWILEAELIFSQEKPVVEALHSAERHVEKSILMLRDANEQSYIAEAMIQRAKLWRICTALCIGSSDSQRIEMLNYNVELFERDIAEGERIAASSRMLILQIELAIERVRMALSRARFQKPVDQFQVDIAFEELSRAEELVQKTIHLYRPHSTLWSDRKLPIYVGVFKEGDSVAYDCRNDVIERLRFEMDLLRQV